ncbi:MAG: carboxypeptidase-like regulatory domain-containing protein [Planctomycetota bacterium]
MRSHLLGIVAVLLLLGLVGLWTLFGPSAAGAGGSGVGGIALAAEPALEPGGEVVAPARFESGAATDRAAVRAADTPRAVSEKAAEKESARLVGRLVDLAGEPVVGATVRAATGVVWLALPLDMEATGSRARGRIETTQSDAAGHFALREGLEPGPLRWAVRADGFAPRREDGLRLGESSPHDLGTLVLQPGVTLQGRVVDRGGKGVADTELLAAVVRGVEGATLTVPGRGVLLGTTGDAGRFRVSGLAHGPWRLILDAPLYQVREEEGRTQAPGEVQSGLIFVLERGEEITGTILGLPVERPHPLRVEARPKLERNRGGSDAGDSQRPISTRARVAQVDTAGAFRVTGLVPGVQHLLTVWRERETGEWSRHPSIAALEAWPGTAGVELEFSAEASLGIEVVDDVSGKPITDFVVWAGLQGGRGRNSLVPLKVEDDQSQVLRQHFGGRARFEGLRPPKQGGRAQIRVRAAGYRDHSQEDLPIARGEHVDLDPVRLERAPVVLVTVLDEASGDPLEDARVFLAPEGERTLQWVTQSDDDPWGIVNLRFARTDAQGQARLVLFAAEQCAVRADTPQHVASEAERVPSGAGQEVLFTVTLAGGATVVVHVVDGLGQPVPAVTVLRQVDPGPGGGTGRGRFSPFRARGSGEVTDAAGSARFEHVPVGDWIFAVQAQEFQFPAPDTTREDTQSVRLVQGARHELTLVTPTRAGLSGVVTEAGLPLAGADLRLSPAEPRGRRGGFRGWYGGGGGLDPLGALTAHDGSYHFDKIAAGDYLLSVHSPDRLMDEVLEVTVSPPDSRLDVALSVAAIEGRVTDAQGLPLAGVRVDVSEQGGRRRNTTNGRANMTVSEDELGNLQPDWNGGSRRITTDAEGRFRLRGLLTDVELGVAVSGPYVVSDRRTGIELAAGEIRRQVNFELAAAGMLQVTVNGAQSRYQVMILREDTQRSARSAWTRNSRPARFSGVATGPWTVKVSGTNGAGEGQDSSSQIEIVAGETLRVTLDVP